MNTKLPLRLTFALCSFLSLANCTSVPIKDYRECTVAGVWQAGMDCAKTNSGKISSMDYQEMIEWLEPQPERPDPKNPGKTLPARAGAVCRSDDDFTAQKTALEQACALLKNACTPEIKDAIDRANANTSALMKNARAKKFEPGNSLEFHRLEIEDMREEDRPIDLEIEESEGPI